jgi:hypothetical protein
MRPARFAPMLRPAAALLCLLAAAGTALAEKPKVKVTARVGLPPAGRTAERDDNLHAIFVSKFATWAPVYVTLEVLDEVKEPAVLVIETPDADGTVTTLTLPLASLADANPGRTLTPAELGPLPYLRPGGGGGETVLTVRTARGSALSEPARISSSIRPREIRTYVVLSLGGRLPGFELPKAAGGGEEAANPTGPIRGGRVELAAIDRVEMLPDQWFGYDAADLVVIPTAASDEFVRRLFGDQGTSADKVKRAALLEWVRRGGRVVISAGSSAALLAQLCQPGPGGESEFQRFLPATIPLNSPSRAVGQVVIGYRTPDSPNSNPTVILTPRTGTFLVANLADKPGRSGWTLIPPAKDLAGPAKEKFAVQSTYGLGKVTLVGFDLDRPPFTESDGRAAFWDWVLREGGANRASAGSAEERTTGPAGEEGEDNMTVALRRHVDTFDGVPVISFGWVAVFIVLYILLIGPVEYYFLKRVLGRLELTWVTFPLIVVTVSAAAYFTAYAVKGRDLKVNKLDVVEVDPASGRVYGTTWFTVFSPRIDTYTVAVTPAEGWTTGDDEPGATLVGWVGSPTGGRPGLVRRRYRYHAEPGAVATALEDVPIQVWSTKSFVANWSGRISPTTPVVESALEHPPGDPDKVIGTFVNRMPFPELHDCVILYGDYVYTLPAGGTILKDQTVRLVLDERKIARQWLGEGGPDGGAGQLTTLHSRGEPDTSYYSGRPGAARPAATDPSARGSTLPMWGYLFYEQALKSEAGSFPRNASMRRLDQSWRLRPENRDEVILVGRVVAPTGAAEELLGGATSPTRLWLKGLPGAGKPRQPIPGTARQETYVRVYLPVAAAGAGR